jgi:4-aminobutyrate aminotransferase-like enzyme
MQNVGHVRSPGVSPLTRPHSALGSVRSPGSLTPTQRVMHEPAPLGSHVFYRKLKRRYPHIVRGDGCYLYDREGRRYLDAVGGAFVANLGHGA